MRAIASVRDVEDAAEAVEEDAVDTMERNLMEVRQGT
jgi:hypothetical protein